jgi:hypothetical protein
MEGAVNIVDAMLVFACGLMLSLVIYWNVDIQNREFVPMDQGQMTEFEDESVSDEIKESIDGAGQYQKMGTVYVDPVSGKMYLATDAPGAGVDGEGSPGTDDAGAGATGEQ